MKHIVSDETAGDFRAGDWLQTHSGRQFWPLDPRPDDVDIHDIAHALSMLCRFGGHCDKFYSVAEHSIHVSNYSRDDALWGLLHDASEAYLVDIPRPLKRMMPNYREIEEGVQQAICRAFDLPKAMPARVEFVDRAILMDERLQIMSGSTQAWSTDIEPLGVSIGGYQPSTAKILFLETFHRLMRAR